MTSARDSARAASAPPGGTAATERACRQPLGPRPFARVFVASDDARRGQAQPPLPTKKPAPTQYRGSETSPVTPRAGFPRRADVPASMVSNPAIKRIASPACSCRSAAADDGDNVAVRECSGLIPRSTSVVVRTIFAIPDWHRHTARNFRTTPRQPRHRSMSPLAPPLGIRYGENEGLPAYLLSMF